MHSDSWLSALGLTSLGGVERVAAYRSGRLAMQSSASDTDICHGRKSGWSLMMELGSDGIEQAEVEGGSTYSTSGV